MYAALKHSVEEIFLLVQNLMEKIDDKLYKIHYHFDVHCPVVLSAHVVDGGGVRAGDLGIAVEPLDVLEEGEELSVCDRIEKK